MQVELIVKGSPSRIPWSEWVAAKSVPAEQLPQLTEVQRKRAARQRVAERDYAVGVKAGDLASERAWEKLERVTRFLVEMLRKREPGAELKTVVWDFVRERFEFVVQKADSNSAHAVAFAILDDVLLEKEGAEKRFIDAVNFTLGGWAD